MLRPLSLSAWLGLAAAATAVPRVAVVGAGINGGSAVHFLRDLLGDGVDITVFEANREPGGRTLTRSFANVTVDVGGTAIYSRNRYVSGFARDFGLQPQAEDDGVNSDIGIWDGRKFRIQVDSDSRLDMGAKLLVRYGFSPLHVIPAVRNAVDGFDKIYDLQEGQKSFETPAAMLEALGVFNLTHTSAYDFFKSLGVEEMFVKEMVDRASRCNYNQPGTMNSFADLISLAGVGVAGHVFGLANGTQAISRGLLRSASRVHLGEHVVKVASHGTGYLVQTTQRSEQFDGVILATPLELAAIQLPAEAKRGIGRGRKYQRTYVTFVHGEINETYFGLKEGAKTKKVPGTILTTEDSSSPFSSFGVHKVFPDGSMVVKLFSRRDLHDSDIQPLFPRVFATFKYVWAAYPKLQPLARENWASFRLDGHALFYTSGLETGASAMEVAAIAGRNGALLMREALQRQDRRAKESKEEVLRMHHKVHSKPLLIEQAYDFGRVFKQSGHL